MCDITHRAGKPGELGILLAIPAIIVFSLAYYQQSIMAGTYQSRVFNFINSQTNRAKNSLGQSWRQVKVSVKWTGQILLAPLRWLNWLIPAPESQIPGNSPSQLPLEESTSPASPVVDRTAITYTAKEANTKLENLLATFSQAGYGLLPSSSAPIPIQDDWSVIDENEWDTTFLDESHRDLAGAAQSAPPLLPSAPVIQGLATLLSNRHLVLIDQHNQVLDVLSSSQQIHICQQIDPIGITALPQATEQLPAATATIRSLSPVPSITVLAPTPALPRTTFQKIGYWCKFYLEYFRVDDGKTVVSGQPLALRPPLQKSLAVTPTAINTLSPTAKIPLNVQSGSIEHSVENSQHLASPKALDSIKVIELKNTSAQSQATFQPEWIDAPSEMMGYEISWLQRLWQWIDRLMLKIETWIIGLYHQLKKSKE
jgi:hypothetical protein